ncbi:FHA domain-containing protein [Leucobacter denitrificans]|uniref:FHA domain-containing protein n=1 Tax=Leucobacter denitrificans TaxID=683042 RepID=A0A7G9S4R3_9MICO|nr:FHA domain-containing protein [Leucobacter denitrificans]QNN62838.1 FHA domain-containing protein [Leucobacter denitrificans]
MSDSTINTAFVSTRAECAYCGTQARPNSMYCMNCGQIVVAPRSTTSRPTLQSTLHAGSHAAPHPATPAAANAPTPPRGGIEQFLLPEVPALPDLPSTHASQRVSDPRPGAAAPLVAPPPRPKLASADTRVIELQLHDGSRVKIDGTAVLGRRPEATARNSGAQAIEVPDESKSVSRAHAIIEVHGQAASISDAGSANGSSVERDGSVLALRSGRQISLRHGDRIWLGSVPVDVHITHQTAEEAMQ